MAMNIQSMRQCKTRLNCLVLLLNLNLSPYAHGNCSTFIYMQGLGCIVTLLYTYVHPYIAVEFSFEDLYGACVTVFDSSCYGHMIMLKSKITRINHQKNALAEKKKENRYSQDKKSEKSLSFDGTGIL